MNNKNLLFAKDIIVHKISVSTRPSLPLGHCRAQCSFQEGNETESACKIWNASKVNYSAQEKNT